MTSHRVAGAPVDFTQLRAELAVPGDFAAPVLAEAQASARDDALPADDATDIPFVTVDPVGSRDLDQAVHIARRDDGFLVSYAIADVASFVAPGGALDDETQRRGETLSSRTHECRCTRPCSARAPRACSPARCGRRCCGRSLSTLPESR